MKFQRAANDTEQWKESQSKTATKISQPDSVFQPKRKKNKRKNRGRNMDVFRALFEPWPASNCILFNGLQNSQYFLRNSRKSDFVQ